MGKGRSRSAAISASTRFCAAVGLKGKNALQRVADFVLADTHGDPRPAMFALAAQRQGKLIIEKLLEDQPHLRGAAKTVQQIEAFALRAENARRAGLRAAWESDSARE